MDKVQEACFPPHQKKVSKKTKPDWAIVGGL